MRPVSPLGWRQGTIARRPSTRRSMRRSTVLTRPPALLVMEQRQDLALRELAAPVEEAQLDDEAQTGDPGAEPFDQADGGRRRPPGGEDVVDHQHLLVVVDRVAVQLEQP